MLGGGKGRFMKSYRIRVGDESRMDANQLVELCISCCCITLHMPCLYKATILMQAKYCSSRLTLSQVRSHQQYGTIFTLHACFYTQGSREHVSSLPEISQI